VRAGIKSCITNFNPHDTHIRLARTKYIHGVSTAVLQVLLQEFHQTYGHIQCIYTVLAKP
jgi:hypothetical protein